MLGSLLVRVPEPKQARLSKRPSQKLQARGQAIGREPHRHRERRPAQRRAQAAIVTVDLRIVSPKAVVNHVTPEAHEYADGPRYASLKGIMKAKKKPMDNKSLGDLGVTASPVLKELDVTLPAPRAAGQMVASVEELVKKLHEEAKAL